MGSWAVLCMDNGFALDFSFRPIKSNVSLVQILCDLIRSHTAEDEY